MFSSINKFKSEHYFHLHVMRIFALIFIQVILISHSFAQVNNYGNFYISPGANVYFNTAFTNAPSASLSYLNDGTLNLTGNFTNNQSSISPGTGSVLLI